MPELKLTERRIRELEQPADKDYVRYWDTEVSGLCVKVTRAGSRRYLFKGSIDGNKVVWHTGPSCSDYSLEDMRDDVREWKVELNKGVNPFRKPEKKCPTVHELCVENLEAKRANVIRSFSKSHLSTLKYATRCIESSDLGKMTVDDVTVVDAEQFLQAFPGRTAEHIRAWLRESYNFAIRRSYVPLGFNPWKYTDQRYQPPASEDLPRFTDEEIASLAEYLGKAEKQELGRKICITWVKYMWFLIRNGTRPRDTRIIHRSWMKERGGVWYIDHPKTKTGHKRFILSAECVKDLQDIPTEEDNVYLFTGRGGTHMCKKKVYREYRHMCKETGITKSAYAIRRWFASTGRKVFDGDVGPVQRLVGWESEEMALRYAGDDEGLLDKVIAENAEICRAIASKVGEVVST